jgi:hypothetical protein
MKSLHFFFQFKVIVKVMLGPTVSQSVCLGVESTLEFLRPDIILCLKVAVLSLWGALSDERSGLSPFSHFHQCLIPPVAL